MHVVILFEQTEDAAARVKDVLGPFDKTEAHDQLLDWIQEHPEAAILPQVWPVVSAAPINLGPTDNAQCTGTANCACGLPQQAPITKPLTILRRPAPRRRRLISYVDKLGRFLHDRPRVFAVTTSLLGFGLFLLTIGH